MTLSPEERLEQWWHDHSLAVLRYAQRRVAPADVEDVVTETFTIAWRRSAEVPDFPLPWLLGVARRVAANTVRSGERRTALLDRLARAHEQSQPSVTDGGIQEALEQLSDDDRELLTLIGWDGLSPHEAADALGCAHATLRVRLHRARGRLRRALTDQVSPSPPAPDPPARQPARPHRPTTPISHPAQEGLR